MSRNYRLARTDFKLMRGFKRLQGAFFSLSYGVIPGRTAPGAATVVSAKTAPKAVTRNSIKRRVRVVLREELVSIKSPLVYVFIARKEAAKASLDEVRGDIHSLMARTSPSR